METEAAEILLIDDEIAMRRLLRVALTAHGYRISEEANGEKGLAAVASHPPDLVLLDLSLPDLDGLEVIKRLREWSEVPLIILSVRGAEDDKITALDAGADDYVTKPFSMGELLARIRTALRHRVAGQEEPVLTFGDLTIDLVRRLVTVYGKEVRLTPTEYSLLRTMATYAGRVLTHRQLLRAVWGPAYEGETHYLRVYIGQLRRKLEKDPARPVHLITEPGVGYRFV